METPTELPIILEASKRLGVRPMLGVRVKLAAKVEGHWNESTGDRSKFGLTTAQIVELVDTLRAHEMLDCLQLLHFHIGSQIPNIRDIRGGAARGLPLLRRRCARRARRWATSTSAAASGVDYDGSQTNFALIMNYSLRGVLPTT